MYEADARGDYRGWDDAYIYITDRDFEPYAYEYECRLATLYEDELEQRMGTLKYWRRWHFLQKMDDWREWGGSRHPSRVYFAEIKWRRRIIRSPEQLWITLAACVRFFVEETKRNPNFKIPELVLRALAKIKAFLDEIWPHIETRYLAIKAEKQATAMLEVPVHPARRMG